MADEEPWRTDPEAALEEARRRMAECDNGILRLQGLALGGEELSDLLAPDHLTLGGDHLTVDGDRPTLQRADVKRLVALDLDNTQVADLGPLSGLSGLRELHLKDTQVADLGPLSGLSGLQVLDIGNTQVADLGPLFGVSGLHTLRLANAQVADLGPLSGLSGLQVLTLDHTQVADLGPLSGLSGLRELRLDNTQVADLGPLSGLSGLRELRLDNTQVADLGPLSGLSGLEELRLDNSQVADLSPLKGNMRLKKAAEAGDPFSGLTFNNTPAADRDDAHRRLAALDRIQCAIQTIEFLNGQHGGPPEPWVPPDRRPPLVLDPYEFAVQNPGGVRWAMDGPTLRHDASGAADPRAERMRGSLLRRAAQLIEACASNQRLPALIAEEAHAYQEILEQPLEEVALDAITLWEISIALGNMIEQDDLAIARKSGDELTVGQRGALQRFVSASATFVRLFPDALEMDESREASARTEFRRDAHIALLQAAQKADVIVAEDGDLLIRLASIAGDPGVPADKARAVTEVSQRNLLGILTHYGGQVVRVGAAAVAVGAAQKVGGDIAAEFELGEKAVEYVKIGAEHLEAIMPSLPPDLAQSVSYLIERARQYRSVR